MPAEISQLGPPLSKRFAPGAPVAVRSSFDGSWCSGYEIADVVDDIGGIVGFRLRRTSDGSVLPVVFPLREVIPAGS